MNPEIKAKWVEALRSGDYAQGTGKLAGNHIENGEPRFCCLGVLCDLAVKEGVIPEPTREVKGKWGNSVSGYFLRFVDDGGYLPVEVKEWAELDSYNPRIGHGHAEGDRQAASWNDDGTSFSEIADMIEASL